MQSLLLRGKKDNNPDQIVCLLVELYAVGFTETDRLSEDTAYVHTNK